MHSDEDPNGEERLRSGARRKALLDLLERSPRPLDATEVGRIVGLHRNTARAHLEALVSAGLAHRHLEHRTTRGRPRVLYERTAASPRSYAVAPTPTEVTYQDLAQLLASQMTELEDVANEAVRAGRRWAAAVDASPIRPDQLTPDDAVRAVADLFERLGFDPEVLLREGRILLHNCPFADVAREARPVVCGMHLGMLKATLERLGAPLEVTEFHPLVQDEPLLCVVGLGEPRPSRTRSRLREPTSDN